MTGLIVNEYPNIKRSFIRSIFGALYAWQNHGFKKANTLYCDKYNRKSMDSNFQSYLRGKICYLKMVLGADAPIYRKAAKRFNLLNPDKALPIQPINKMNAYPLRGNSPKEPWKLWYRRYTPLIHFLECCSDQGNKLSATGFRINPDIIATAKHNFKYSILSVYYDDKVVDQKKHYPEYDEKPPDVAFILTDPNIILDKNWIPTQMRLPEIGEEVSAIGYPVIPNRNPTIVMHTGVVEALPVSFDNNFRYIQVSFQSGGGLSGAPLIDKRGFVIGIMIENTFRETDSEEKDRVPKRPYGQAVPIEYLWDLLFKNNFI